MQRETFAQELRLTSTSAGTLRWLFGAFYADEEAESKIASMSPEVAADPKFSTIVPDGFIAAVQHKDRGG